MNILNFLNSLGIRTDAAFGYYDFAKKLISTQKVDTTGKFYHTCKAIERVIVLREKDFYKLVEMAAKSPDGPGEIEY